MPPVREDKIGAAPTARVTPTPKSDPTPSQSAALRSRIGNSGMAAFEKQLGSKIKAASPSAPDWIVRAAVISRSEELRTRQQLQQDGVTGKDAGHNDIYDAERHARWMYRLTSEVGAWAGKAIGALKEAWGMSKGAGGSETAMDLHNNEVGRSAALQRKLIPDRHTTGELVFLDAATGKLVTNAQRLLVLRKMSAATRAMVAAAAAAGAAAWLKVFRPRATWRWDQSAGTLSHNGKAVGKGYAGHGEGKNNPAMQDVRSVGPIPAGLWRMVSVKDSPKTGQFTIVLMPEPGTDTRGRSEFRIHGDSRKAPGTASEGCIILNRTIRETIWASREKEPLIEVIE